MNARQPKAASIWDVAKLAGVSHQTVSRVVNGSPQVADTTRTRVLEAISELDYRPNRLARALAGGAAQSVTVLTSDTSRYGEAATLRGIEEAARAAGFSVSISVLNPDETRTDADIMALLPHSGAPAIVIAYDEPGVLAMQTLRAAQPLTTVAACEYPGDDHESSGWLVWLDDCHAARRATRHLLDLGHRTVHHLAIPSSTGKAQRAQGWSDELAAAGRAVPEPVDSGWSIRSAFQAAERVVADPAVTAILCGNDDHALGVLRAAHLAGRDVPGDLSVVGFDDTPFSEFVSPSLTTVNLDFEGLGRGAFELLHHRLDPSLPKPDPSWDAPELIVRETSGPPDQ